MARSRSSKVDPAPDNKTGEVFAGVSRPGDAALQRLRRRLMSAGIAGDAYLSRLHWWVIVMAHQELLSTTATVCRVRRGVSPDAVLKRLIRQRRKLAQNAVASAR